MLSVLAEEIFGPGNRLCQSKFTHFPDATIIKADDTLNFETWEEYNKIYCTECEDPIDSSNKSLQPIIKEESPLKKFGLGILYPSTDFEDTKDEQPNDEGATEESGIGMLSETNRTNLQRSGRKNKKFFWTEQRNYPTTAGERMTISTN